MFFGRGALTAFAEFMLFLQRLNAFTVGFFGKKVSDCDVIMHLLQ